MKIPFLPEDDSFKNKKWHKLTQALTALWSIFVTVSILSYFFSYSSLSVNEMITIPLFYIVLLLAPHLIYWLILKVVILLNSKFSKPSPEDIPAFVLPKFPKITLIIPILFIIFWLINLLDPVLLTVLDSTRIGKAQTQDSISAVERNRKTKTWINCNDVRAVVEEDGNIFAGCLGGVLIVDKQSGDIVDEINFQDGLISDTVTDLLSYQSKLYIGTQEGLHIYDQVQGLIEVISTEDGLPSNKNIRFKLDPPHLWISTFNGLAKLDTNTIKVEDITSDIASDSKHMDGVIVTPDSVYAFNQKRVYRYDKSSQQLDVVEFEGQDITISDLSYHDGMVFVHGWDEVILGGKDLPNINFEEYSPLAGKLSAFGPSYYTSSFIGTYNEYDYFILKNGIYRINFSINGVELFSNDVPIISSNYPILTDKLWVFSENASDDWLHIYDLQLGDEETITLDRPTEAVGVVGAVDNNVFLLTNNGLHQIDMSDNNPQFTFIKYVELSHPSPSHSDLLMIPMPQTSKLLFQSQSCSLGCDVPRFFLYDYVDRTIENIDLNQGLINVIPPSNNEGGGYGFVTYNGIDDSGKTWWTSDAQYQFYYSMDEGWGTGEAPQNLNTTAKRGFEDCGVIATFDSIKQIFTDSAEPSCNKEGARKYMDRITSLVELQNLYVGTYEWGGLFSIEKE